MGSIRPGLAIALRPLKISNQIRNNWNWSLNPLHPETEPLPVTMKV
jgi:hypothetical protein